MKTLIHVLMAIGFSLSGFAAEPYWWASRGVLKPSAQPADYAVLNQGQLKQFAKAACGELDATLPGGAGAQIHNLVASWANPGISVQDYAAVNVGQLKSVAKPFYARLIASGYVSSYPWAASFTNVSDYAIANIGQAKNLFKFNIALDIDGLGLQDWWELKFFGAIGRDALGDYDGDNVIDYMEFFIGTDPTLPDSDQDGQEDSVDPHPLTLDPHPPANFKVVIPSLENVPPTPSIDYTTAVLRWDSADVTQGGFQIERQIDEGAWEIVANLVPAQSSFPQGNLVANQTYRWRIHAVGTPGDSENLVSDYSTAEYKPPFNLQLLCNFSSTIGSKGHTGYLPGSRDAYLDGSTYYLNATGHGTRIRNIGGENIQETATTSDIIDPLQGTRTTVLTYNATGPYLFSENNTLRQTFQRANRQHDTESVTSRIFTYEGWDSDFDLEIESVSKDIDYLWTRKFPVDYPQMDAIYSGKYTIETTKINQYNDETHEIDPYDYNMYTSNLNAEGGWTNGPPEILSINQPYGGEITLSQEFTTEMLIADVMNDRDKYAADFFDYFRGYLKYSAQNPGLEWPYPTRVEIGRFSLGSIAMYPPESVLAWSKGRYRFKSNPSTPKTLLWWEVFLPDDDYDTPDVDESKKIKILNARSWTIGSTTESEEYELSPDPQNGNGLYDLLFLPLELETRDRGITGSITIPEQWNDLSLKFTVGDKELGTYNLTDENGAYIYDSEDAMFSDTEVEAYNAHDGDSLRAINQPVAFYRSGDQIKFATVADNLGTLKVSFIVDGNEVGAVERQLTADNDFRRVIVAAEGMIAGDAPPAKQAWPGYPTTGEPDSTDAPPDPNSTPTPQPSSARSAGFRTNSISSPGGTGPLYNHVPTTRNQLTLPNQIRNRGLVAKSLLFFIQRAIKGQVANAEGTIFGVWDGVKGDVEGVIDTLRLPLDFIKVLEDPYKTAGELWHTFKLVKERGWEGVTSSVNGMIEAFIGSNKNRLSLALGSECEDPAFLNAYFAGYITGFIGEQVAGTLFTAGITKIGVIGRALRLGKTAAVELLSSVSTEAKHIQQISRGFAVDFGRCSRSADELREARRSASLCRTITGCLAAGTLVAMGDGSWKAIENIHSGDVVLAADPEHLGVNRTERVASQIFNRAPVLFQISWDEGCDGTIDGVIEATPKHPFHANGRWQSAGDLKGGETITTISGKKSVITGVEIVTREAETYNLDVDGPNTFFVATSKGSAILVHNAEGHVFAYGDSSIVKGQSQFYLKSGEVYIPQWNDPPDNMIPRPYPNEAHHFFFDAWLKANFTNLPLADKRVQFPAIELTYLQHKLVHEEGNKWLVAHGFVRDNQMGERWKELDLPQMQDLARHMLVHANIEISIKYPLATPIQDLDSKLSHLKNLSTAALKDFRNRIGGCPL